MNNNQLGFTLLELAISIAIISVLLGFGLQSLNTYLEYSKYNQDKKSLVEYKKLLLNYVTLYKHLPCPDVTNDGAADRNNDFSCASYIGNLPYLDLGITPFNAFGRYFRYVINRQVTSSLYIQDKTRTASFFNSNNAPVFNLDTPPNPKANGYGNFNICNKFATICNSSTSSSALEARSAIALIISFGKNEATCQQSSMQERQNCSNTPKNFYILDYQKDSSNFFDDQLLWISSNEVKLAAIVGNSSFK